MKDLPRHLRMRAVVRFEWHEFNERAGRLEKQVVEAYSVVEDVDALTIASAETLLLGLQAKVAEALHHVRSRK